MSGTILLGLTLVVSLAVTVQAADKTDVKVSMMVNQFFMAGKDGGENSGFAMELLKAHALMLPDINFIITPRPDLTYSKRKGDAADNGNCILDALIDKTADLVGPDLTRTSQDEAVVDFLQPYVSYKLRIVVNTKTGINAKTQYVMVDNEDLAYLAMSKNASLMAIYQNIMKGKPGSLVADAKAGAAKVLGGNFALITENVNIPNLLDKNPKTLMVVPNGLGGYFSLGFAVQQNSPLREAVNIVMLKLIEDGTVKALLTKYGMYYAPN